MRTQGNDGDIWVRYDIGVGVGFYSAKYKNRRLALKSMMRGQLEENRTFISNDNYLSTFSGNTQGMVLHARASSNIPQDEDLHSRLLLLRLSGRRSGWDILRGEQ